MLILYTVGPSEPSVQVLPITVYNYQVREVLHKNFSQFGLLHRLHLGEGEEGTYFAYVQVSLLWVSCRTSWTTFQYYSQRAASAARQATRPKPGSISLKVDYECNCNPDA